MGINFQNYATLVNSNKSWNNLYIYKFLLSIHAALFHKVITNCSAEAKIKL